MNWVDVPPLNHGDERFVTKREALERITLVGPHEDGLEVMERLHNDGWWMIQSGPYCDNAIHPTVDVTRFMFVAERKIP